MTFARLTEVPEGRAVATVMRGAEIRNRLVIGNKPARKPHREVAADAEDIQ